MDERIVHIKEGTILNTKDRGWVFIDNKYFDTCMPYLDKNNDVVLISNEDKEVVCSNEFLKLHGIIK